MRQRDANTARQKGTFFRPGDNSPSSGHLTRSVLLCQILFSIIIRFFKKARKKGAVSKTYRALYFSQRSQR